jgi:hypothetical protein
MTGRHDSRNRTGRTGQAKKERQNVTGRTGQEEQERKKKERQTGKAERDRQTEQAELTDGTGLQNKIDRTGDTEQNW